MIALHPEYIIDDSKKKKAVIIKIDEWEKIVEKLEELEDIESYDKEKSKMSEIIPFEQAIKEIEKGKIK